MSDVLVDAGPLIALLHRSDAEHPRVRDAFSASRGRVFTTWPVLTEAAHIVGRADMRSALVEMLQSAALQIAALGDEDFDAIAWFQAKYRDRNPDLADLTLLVAAERHRIRTILTLDRDFRIYRTRQGRLLHCPLLK